MSSSGTVTLGEIWAMLDECASGHQRKQKTHNWVITYKDKTYQSLPVGEHGARRHVSIQVGHVKKMVRVLEISDCAKKRIERLR